MSSRRVVLYCAYVAGVTITFLLVTAEMAEAHNCQNFTDCFASADAATDSLLGMTFLGMLSMGLDFVPYVGTAKGVVEAVTGRDLLTGEELSDAERLLGLVPGGLGHAGDMLSSTRHLDEMASVAGGGLRHGDELADAARHADDVPPALPPPPTRTPPPPPRPPGLHVTTPRGTTYNVPDGWVGRPADNGRGIVFQRPGAPGNADMIRIMEPTPQYPNGYARYYNSHGQPVDVNGRPGSRADTHIPEDYQGPITGWPSP